MPELSEGAQKQGALWGKLARQWAHIQECIEHEVWAAMLDRIGLGVGSRLLDCGCGAGGALMHAAERGAAIAGFDPSVNMLTIARERMPNSDLRLGELESIPWPNGEFDRVISANTLQFTQNPQLAVHEMGRVCAEGGKVAIAIWDDVHTCDLGRVYNAIVDLFPKPPRGRGVFALSAPGVLESLLDSVPDIRMDKIETIESHPEYPSLDEAVRGQMSAGATQRAVELFGEERVSMAVRDALQPLVTESGQVILRNQCRIAIATK